MALSCASSGLRSSSAVSVPKIVEIDIIGRDHILFTEHHRRFDNVLQLADITRPPMSHEQIDGLLAEAGYRLAGPVAELGQEDLGKPGDVLFPFAQGALW